MSPPHPATTLADALNDLDHDDYAAEVLRLLRTGECDELNAAVADAVAANPERYGLEWIATTDVNSPEPELHYRFARREQADQEGRDDGD